MKSPLPPVPNPRCQPGQPQDLLRLRARWLSQIRAFFQGRDFLEVETPLLIPCADPSVHLSSFRTRLHPPAHSEAPVRPLFLHTSPEFAMKRLVAAGYPRLFQICKFFRDSEVSPLHNPEFTGLEWYSVGHDYHVLMDLTEAMICDLWQDRPLSYQGQTIDLSTPWERISCSEAIARHVPVSIPAHPDTAQLADACRTLGLSVDSHDAWEDLYFKIFLTHVEPHLGKTQPTFLYDYPIQMAALSRAKPSNPLLAERVELYIAGLEIANGYSELNDPTIQRQRWREEADIRQQNGESHPYPPDPGLLNALEWGMPPCAGIAVGIDRLLMLYLDTTHIDDVLPFPISSTMWPPS